MFGYVRICRQELSEKDFNCFNAYYCGLCKAIGKYSNAARMGLSYDMAFLAVLLDSLSEEDSRIGLCRCALHPIHKKSAVKDNIVIDYAASMSILLSYRKLEDDWLDDKDPKALAGGLMYKKAVKKAAASYPEQYEKIGSLIAEISKLEKENCCELDKMADCFAKICEEIFAPDFIAGNDNKKVLSWMGYNIGRWIYIIDAFDDLKKDLKNKAYNPLACRVSDIAVDIPALAGELEVTLTFTLSNIAAAYDILQVKRNDALIKNILYAGLAGVQAKILNIREDNNGSVQGSRGQSG